MATDVEIKAGSELDRAVAEAIGEFGKPYWVASTDGGESYCASTHHADAWSSEYELREWLRECKERGHHLDYEIVELRDYPHYNTDLNAAFTAAEKVGLFDDSNVTFSRNEEGQWHVENRIGLRDGETLANQPTLALAICAAILKLKDKDG